MHNVERQTLKGINTCNSTEQVCARAIDPPLIQVNPLGIKSPTPSPLTLTSHTSSSTPPPHEKRNPNLSKDRESRNNSHSQQKRNEDLGGCSALRAAGCGLQIAVVDECAVGFFDIDFGVRMDLLS